MRKAFLLIAFLCIAAPSHAQDPVSVDSKHYTVMLENEHVRVLKILYRPGEKSVMHEHPDSVAIFLDDSNGKFTMPDGTSTPTTAKAGETRFTPAGKHLPENVGSKSFSVVLVELKGGAGKSTAISLDPIKIDPEHHKIEFENDRVRVMRVHIKPKEKLKEHEHPNGVAVFLTDIKSKFTLADGKTREGGGKRGEVMWSPAEKHIVENTGNRRAEVVFIELR